MEYSGFSTRKINTEKNCFDVPVAMVEFVQYLWRQKSSATSYISNKGLQMFDRTL